MSLVDTLKGLLGKGKEAVEQNADKINEAVDKAGTFIDEKTGGKYSDKIEKGKDAAKKVVPPQSGTGQGPASGTTTPPNTAPGATPGATPPKPGPGTTAGGAAPTDPGPQA
ncbi:Rv0909 family putative TA system antitoxin [Nocardia sp. NPDC055029]|uniref:antitoxin n=1 Tax=Nocardia sp. NPDC060259 TaxID=3347088 RepID=UPI00365F39CE